MEVEIRKFPKKFRLSSENGFVPRCDSRENKYPNVNEMATIPLPIMLLFVIFINDYLIIMQ